MASTQRVAIFLLATIFIIATNVEISNGLPTFYDCLIWRDAEASTRCMEYAIGHRGRRRSFRLRMSDNSPILPLL
uniref:Secreted protein n=1 Tax=Ascaris lumbricoides TaxID=6252 RepID=A0A0M3I7I2_ASCLU